MRRRFAGLLVAFLLAAGVAATAALAQQEAEKSAFVTLLENLISTPDRRISITGLEGAFSANPRIERLALSDRDGVWLELEGLDVTWDRSALLDRTLHIERLRARRVAFLRRPLPAESAAAGGAGMPIAVTIDAISLPLIALSEPVAGVAAELAAAGAAQLTEEALAAQLSVYRQDRAGTLTAELRLQPDANVLTADLTLEEPPGGLIAELLELPDRPAIAVRLSGAGPLDSWDATLQAEAAGEPVLDGSVAISRLDAGYRLAAEMKASLQRLAPADYAALVAGESRLALDVTRADDGAVAIDAASLRSDGLDLTASGALAPDLVPQSAILSLRLGQAGRAELPFAPGELSVGSLQVDAELEAGEASPWRAGVVAEEVESSFGRLARMAVNASGEARSLTRPPQRSVSFQASGSLQGLAPSDPGWRDALGPELRLAAEGSWSAGDPAEIANLQLVLNDAAASFAGTATTAAVDGSFGVTVSDLSRFAALAGRALAGSAQLEASGAASRDGRLDLRLDGNTVDLRLGVAALDPWLAGATRLAGGVARSDDGLAFDSLVLANDRMTAEISGEIADPALDLSLTADVADLSLVSERAAGTARISAQLTGTRQAPRVEAEATGDEVVLMGRPLVDASARFAGIVAGPETAGDAEISGTLAGAPLSGAARLSAGEDGARRIDGLSFTVGESQVTGDLAVDADGLFSGSVALVSPDLSKVAPLFLVEAGGMLRAEVTLAAEDGAQSADISATAADVVYESVTLETAEIEARARDLFDAPQIEGDFSLRNGQAGGLTVVAASGRAERRGQVTALSAEAALADGRAAFDATLEPRDGGLGIGLERLSLARGDVDLALASPTTIVVADGTARLDGATLRAGTGRVTIAGQAGQTLDLAVDLANVPAALADSFSPGLGAQGAVSGNVAVEGTASAPVARFEMSVAGASVAASRNAGLGPLTVSADGDFADDRLRLASRISGAGGLAVAVDGTVGATGGAPLDLKISGAAPLSLGNPQLAARGAALRGALDIDIAVTGTAAAPQFAGRVTADGGGLVDPQSGIVLSNLSLAASVSNNRLVIDRLTATSGEGTVAAEGSLGLDPNAGLPVDMRIDVRNARYVDGALLAATFDADLALSGSLTATPSLSGRVTLDRTEVTVPESLPADSVAVSVEHVAPPQPVEQTLAIVRERQGRGEARGEPSGIALDLTIDAPRRIFVRGRGLDAELGGSLKLLGSTSSVVAAGSFELVRGRLDILTQRITLDRGVITFAGDLDPILDFVGTTQSGDVTITITISGRASDPQVAFTSIPELPQDEVLAQLIFQKGISELSPLQIARLGAAAAELAGGGGGGVLSQLRASTGLDDLDIVVDEEGQAALAAGRYISENVYIGVQQGVTAESSKVTIDLDITKGVKARAGYSVEGESSLGIFFEKEY